MMTFSLTVLGSSAALPTSQRFPAAHLLRLDERFFMIDCGEGTQMQLRRYKLKFQHIKAIFISHLHGDHVFGLPGLLSSLSALGRSEPLEIFGPPVLEEWLSSVLKYFSPLGFTVTFHELTTKEPVVIYEDKYLTVTSFPLRHRIPTWGFLFREKEKLLNIRKDMIGLFQIPLRDIPTIKAGADFVTSEGRTVRNAQLTHPRVETRSFAYCSDTMYLETLKDILQDVDLLYHEATFSRADQAVAKETFHSTAEEAAKIAKATHAKQLVIGHFSARYKDIEPLLQEARAIFENTEAADDGRVFEII